MDNSQLDARLQILMRSPIWAIRPEAALTAILQLTNGHDGSRTTLSPDMPGRSSRVAVIPIHGVLTNDGPNWYGSKYQDIANAAENAVASVNGDDVVMGTRPFLSTKQAEAWLADLIPAVQTEITLP